MNKTLVFDMHGVIYSHDKNSSIQKSNQKFDAIITSQNPKNEKQELELEFNSIQAALNHKQNQLDVYPMPKAIERLKQAFQENDQIVIISTSNIQTQKLILKTFLNDSNENLIQKIDFYNSSEYGSKSKPETWLQILKNYENISELYEDTQNYLDAAKYAVTRLGFENCIFSNKI